MFVVIFTVLTVVTMGLAPPGELITIRGVVSFLAMAIIGPALIYMNYFMLPKVFPQWVKPHPITRALMWLCSLAYVTMAIGFIVITMRG